MFNFIPMLKERSDDSSIFIDYQKEVRKKKKKVIRACVVN